jgi:hypothetical protein
MNMGNGRLLTTHAAWAVDERAVVCFQQTCDVEAVSRSGQGAEKQTSHTQQTALLASFPRKTFADSFGARASDL